MFATCVSLDLTINTKVSSSNSSPWFALWFVLMVIVKPASLIRNDTSLPVVRRSKSIRNYEMVIKLLLLLLHQHHQLRLTGCLLGIDKILKFIGISDDHHLHKFPIYRNKINISQGIIFHWGFNLALTTIHKLNYFRSSSEEEMGKEETSKIFFGRRKI